MAGGPRLVSAAGLTASTQRSTDGVYQLSWSDPGDVLLEESSSPSFADPRVVYRGGDQATTLTGRPDGVYYYRLRTPDGAHALEAEVAGPAEPWLSVTVDHHDLSRALAFFGVGLVVFVATAGLVFQGARREQASPRDGSHG